MSGEAAAFMSRIGSSAKFPRLVLAFSHADILTTTAGTERAIRAEKALFNSNGISYVQIFAKRDAMKDLRAEAALFGLNVDDTFIGYLQSQDFPHAWKAMERFGLRIQRIHLHHLLGISPQRLETLLGNLSVPTTFFIHDYYSACPQINFIKNDREYCGGPPPGSEICKDCKYGETRIEHFDGWNRFFSSQVNEFVTPSTTSAQEWSRSFPHLAGKLKVVPHLREVARLPPVASSRGDFIRVAYVGYETELKGFSTWQKISRAFKGNTYRFYQLGQSSHCDKHVSNIAVRNVEDENAMVRALEKHRIDIALLWSRCPETYSYTFFESLMAGCLVVTNPHSGNIAREIASNGMGLILENESALMSFFKDAARVEQTLEAHRAKLPKLVFESNREGVEQAVASLSDSGASSPTPGVTSGTIFEAQSGSEEYRALGPALVVASQINAVESEVIALREKIHNLGQPLWFKLYRSLRKWVGSWLKPVLRSLRPSDTRIGA